MIRRFLLLLAFVLPLAAQTPRGVTIEPAAPNASDAVTIRIPLYCPSENPVVTREGSIIRIDLTGPPDGCPVDPPLLVEQIVTIGSLPAGSYTVEVYSSEDRNTPYARGTFAVGPAAIELYPFAIPANLESGITVVIPYSEELLEICLDAPGCRQASVGGITVPLRFRGDLELEFTAPQHAPGFVDIVLTNGTKTITSKNALYYFDRNAAPDPQVFERILFPVMFDAPGAVGSHWRTEAVIANRRPWAIETFNDIQPIVCVTYPCGERLAPHSRAAWVGGNYPAGVALIASRNDAEHLAFSLRARDVSRVSESFGTEVPVVREAQMFDGTITLLDVPLDPRYRVKVRVYAFAEGEARLTGLAAPQTFELRRPQCSGPAACAAIPAYTAIDLAPGAADQRVNLYIDAPPGTKAWAFASVTNNETQQVTTVTPDGIGGIPCAPCTTP
jgi:hypothetical protein